MKIEYLEEFMNLVEIGNFTQAANRLYMTQPALSKHISSLEKELGVQLLVRSTHGFELTPIGVAARDIFDDILTSYHSLETKIAEMSAVQGGILRLGMVHSALDRFIKPAILLFRKNYPNVKLSLISGTHAQVIRDILDGNVDITFTFRGDFRNSMLLEFVDVGSEPLRVAVSETSPLATKRAVSIKELNKYAIITLGDEPEASHFMTTTMYKLGLHPMKTVSTEGLASLSYVVEESNGFFLVPDFMVYEIPDNLVVVDLEEEVAIPYAFAYRKGNENVSLPLFLECVAKAFPTNS